ncbi:MAG: Tol-Pal system beta propeller repeat protein TolB [Sphingomicrobium sp.]
MLKFLALGAALLASPALAQDAAPQQVVQAPTTQGTPTVMVPPLTTPKVEQTAGGPTNSLGLQVAEVIAADLRSTGAVMAIGPAKVRVYSYPEVTGPLFSAWRSLGAKSLVTGFVQARQDGRLTIACYVYDVPSGRELARKGFVVPVDGWRRGAHRCADAIYTGLTKKPGQFDTRIVYVAESGPAWERIKRLAVMDADGSNHQYLTAGTSTAIAPSISPAGDRIVYTSFFNRQPQLRVVDVATGAEQPLVALPGMTFGPAFAPDGQRIAFSMAMNGNTDLFVVDGAGGMLQRLTLSPGTDTGASFSPDGKRIVFESDRSGTAQIYVMNADGSGQRRISFGGASYGAPSWSPDGDMILFRRTDPRGSGIGVMTATGSDERMLTTNLLDDGPAWAPSGQMAIFYRPDPVAGRSALLTVPLSGGEPRPMQTPQDGSDPSWSAVQQ